MNQTYDLIIIGGGPAGVAAGVYAARKQLKTLFIAKEFGGQSIVSDGIKNWIGTETISGMDLAKNLEKHLRSYAGEFLEIKDSFYVEKLSKNGDMFSVQAGGNSYDAKAVLITTGSERRKLTVPGAKEYENKGITYCASCDGPLFAHQDVAVIGAGNAAFETAAQLLAYTKSVTLLNRSDVFKADEITVKKVLAHPNMKVISNAELAEIKGEKFVTSLTYTDSKTNESHTLPVTGIFVEIGAIPATSFAKDLISTNHYGAIVTDPKNQRTSTNGVWAAGDCTDGLYHQNNIAAGDAVKALEDIYLWIKTK